MRARHVRAGVAALLLLVLSACASLGIPQPKTFSQSLVAAYAADKAVMDSATAGLNGGVLKADDGRQVLKLADGVRDVLDGARAAYAAGDAPGAQSKLNMAASALQAVQKFLTERGVK